MLQVASKRSLLYPILRSRLHLGLEKIIREVGRLPPGDICLALDVVDVMAHSALKASNNNMTEEDYEVERQQRQAERYHRQNSNGNSNGNSNSNGNGHDKDGEGYGDSDSDSSSDCPSDMEDDGEREYYRRSTRAAIEKEFATATFVQR